MDKFKKWIVVFVVSVVYSHVGYAHPYLSPVYENIDKFTTLDSAYLKCAYKLTYLCDSLKINDRLTDQQTLLIGKTVSKYYSQTKLDHNQFVKNSLNIKILTPVSPMVYGHANYLKIIHRIK